MGIGNQKLFLLFILFTSVVCGYALILVISRFSICALSNLECGDEIHFLFILFLFLESLLFLLFTLCMLGDQLSSMRSNQTSIDRLKNQKHDIRVEVNEVCGSSNEIRFQLRWLMPIPVFFNDSVKERIMGYRLNTGTAGEYCLSSNSNSKEEVTPLMLRERDSEGKEAEMIELKSDQIFDNLHVSTAPKINRSSTEANDTIKVIQVLNPSKTYPTNKFIISSQKYL